MMRHLRTPEAARYLGVSPSFLNHARLRGNGPAYRKLSAKVVCYDLADLQAWASSKTKRSTSGSPP
jgi:predicted DNA-binding transcriptional regulator AlpA